jgi:AraC-like DNA-binding protein
MSRHNTDECKPTRVFTDVPTRVTPMPGGLIDSDTPANMFIHWATTWLENPENEGLLAVRWVANGERVLQIGRSRVVIDDSAYHIMNYMRRFSSTIHSDHPVECFTATFQPAFANDVFRSLISSSDRLLDVPQEGWQPPIEFLEKLYPHDDLLSPALYELQSLVESGEVTHGRLEEQFHCILERMLQVHREVYRQMERMPAVRASTREELYRRLHVARDYMESNLDQPLTIPQIAAAACFSPHHFLRLFRQVFGETPHQYLTRRRMERAVQLLSRTDHRISDICLKLGFESLGSFSWLFRRHFGVSPEGYRVRHRYPGIEPPPEIAGLNI